MKAHPSYEAQDPHERIDALVTRVNSLEQWMEDFKIKWSDAVREIQANTALTEEIHGDTKDIVEAVKFITTGKRVFMAVCLGLASIAGAVVAVAEAWRALH